MYSAENNGQKGRLWPCSWSEAKISIARVDPAHGTAGVSGPHGDTIITPGGHRGVEKGGGGG